MLSKAKHQILFVGSDELVPCMIGCRASLPQLVRAEAVKDICGLGVEVIGGILIDGMGSDFDVCTGWYVLAVGEREAAENLTLKGRKTYR